MQGHEASYLCDNTWQSWYSNSAQKEEQTSILLQFDRPTTISCIAFRNGAGNLQYYFKNSRAKDIDIYFGNELKPESITLQDSNSLQLVNFLYAQRRYTLYDKIRLVIKSSYEGTKSRDIGITEISINRDTEDNFVNDPYSEAMQSAIKQVITDEPYKIFLSEENAPIMIVQKEEGLEFYEYNSKSWVKTHSKRKDFAQMQDIYNKNIDKFNIKVDFSDNLALQLYRKELKDYKIPYSTPYIFNYDGTNFTLERQPSTERKTIFVQADELAQIIKKLDTHSLYDVKVSGSLTKSILQDLYFLMQKGNIEHINGNLNLDLSECTYPAELNNTLEKDSIQGIYGTIILPNSTEVLRRGAICVSAEKIILPDDIKKIEAGAFVGDNNILGNIFNASPNIIAFNASPKHFILKDGLLLTNDSEDSVLLCCSDFSKQTVTIPNNVQKIAPYAFYGARVMNISFPQHLQTIGDCAFANAEFGQKQTVTIPKGVTEIGREAFAFSKIYKLVFPFTLKLLEAKTLQNITDIQILDISQLNIANFPYTTVEQLSTLLDANPNLKYEGDFHCIKVSGKLDNDTVSRIEETVTLLANKKVFLDLGKTSLIWNEALHKFNPLPEMFLYGHENLLWLNMGDFDYIPVNACRKCSELRYIHFPVMPKRLGQMALQDIHPMAMCITESGQVYTVKDFEEKVRNQN